jgi:hypothetical protein
MLQMMRTAASGYLAGAGRILETALLSFAAGFLATLAALPLLVPPDQASTTSAASHVSPPVDVASVLPAGATPLNEAAAAIALPEPDLVPTATPIRVPGTIAPPEAAARTDAASPSLRVAERIEVEVGRATPIAVVLDPVAPAPEGSVLILHGIPHGLALFPATPLEPGAWSVDAAEMKSLQAVRYIHDPIEHVVAARLLRRDGTLIAEADMTIAPRGPTVSETTITRPASMDASQPATKPIAVPDVPATVVATALPASRPPTPVFAAKPAAAPRPIPARRAVAHAPSRQSKRAARVTASKRTTHASKPKLTSSVTAPTTPTATASFVWPGDRPPHRRALR